ncbi:MAG: excinuclease ABC subunit UvrC [Alphaproteobacteria bacterium]|nr:excinuclease ABC subunit UvrC [Alphaproteobacteria bacterium]
MSKNPEKLTPLERGSQIIRDYVANLPATPGVYRMISETGEILYVGKAKALKKRVISYTHIDKLPMRLKRMVALTASMEFVHTHTEVEALLLESNLIKKLKPRYNILLRDDKSFPYILITGDHDFPQIKKHRGARKPKGEYFGPFASAGAVNHTIHILQRVFKLRNCSDSVFSTRERPCLQYHIKRCTAPCVARVTKEEYAEQVDQARAFLSGQSRVIQEKFADEMQVASEAEEFEKAAEYRDRIKVLSTIQSRQDINLEGVGDVDVMALAQSEGKSCVQVFFFRGGQNFGNRAYFPRHDVEETQEDIMSVFMAQFYENKPVPKQVFVSHDPSERGLLEEALTTRRDRGRVEILKPSRGKGKRVIDFVMRNAQDALKRHLIERAGEVKYLEAVGEIFGMDEAPKRIEVYDNSHISGTNMVGAMIVAGQEGFHKNAYRKFNIKEAKAADDYGMMREVMTRRFTRALKDGVDTNSEDWPDLLLIDGGKGQFGVVKETLEELGVYDDLTVVAIAKGEDRNAGREEFIMEGRAPFQLPVNDPTLHYLQRIRDEVHRYAIGAHRTRRKNDISKSPLDQITGIGAHRKRALLLHFGSAKEVAKAGIDDLRKVDGISEAIAEKIYNFFNEG